MTALGVHNKTHLNNIIGRPSLLLDLNQCKSPPKECYICDNPFFTYHSHLIVICTCTVTPEFSYC